MPNDNTTVEASEHRLQIGSRAQKIVAEVLRRGPVPVRTELASVAREIFNHSPVQYRPRETLLEAVTAAGVYLSRLRPLDGWTFSGSEVHHGTCRFDLVWAHAWHGHLIDEIKLGIGRGSELAVRNQIDHYLEV